MSDRAEMKRKADKLHAEYCHLAQIGGGVASLDQLIDVLELVRDLLGILTEKGERGD